MFVNVNQVTDLHNGSKHSNGWANVQNAVKSNNVQTFRRIDFQKAKSDFSSNSTAPVAQNGIKKVVTEAPKKPVPKDTKAGLFEASKAVDYVQWKQVARVGPGFFNDGNTCYLNSTLQCLMYTPALAQIMRKEQSLVLKNFRQVQDQPKAIIQYFQRLVEEVWTSPAGRSLSPRSMVSNIRRVGKQFKPFRQEDAHEYLRQLLDCMHEEILKANGVKLSDGKIAETTAISRVFGGYLCNTLTCSKCNYASKTFNHFQDVSLDITSGINSVNNALDHFTKPEFLSHGNEWKCEKCQIKVKAKKQMTFSQLPNVLVLHLKRFNYGLGKNMKPINFTPSLTVTCHKETGVKKVNYELHGVVVHHGSSTHSGHYVAFVKAPNGSWYEMNDTSVNVVSINKVLSCQAYILFYSRVIPVAAAVAPVAPATASAASVTNGVSKPAADDVGEVVKPKPVVPAETGKPKVHPVSSSTIVTLPPAEAKKDPKTGAPDVSLSESSDDDSDSDFSEPSDLDNIPSFTDRFAKRLKGEESDEEAEEEDDEDDGEAENGNRLVKIRAHSAIRFTGYLFPWKSRVKKSIRELRAMALLKKKRSVKTTPTSSTSSSAATIKNDDVEEPVVNVPEVKKSVPPPPASVTAPTSSPKVYPTAVPVVNAAVASNAVAAGAKSSSSSSETNGHAKSSAVEQSPVAAPVKKPSNVVIFNNGVSANGMETTKNLIALSNRSRDTSGEGTWDSVSKELAEEAHALVVQQRRDEQKARNEKRLDAWNQKLDEGRVKKVKTGPTAYEAAFAGGKQPENLFQQVQDVRGTDREAYFEAGSAPFEKKRKQPFEHTNGHGNGRPNGHSSGHFNGKFNKHQNGHNNGQKGHHNGFKKQKQY